MPILDAIGKMISSLPDGQYYKGEFQPAPAQSGRSALKLRPGFSYLALFFEFFKAGPAAMSDAEIDAAVASIDILIDAKQKCGLSSTVLRVINKFNTDLFSPMPANSGYFPIFFARHWMATEEDQDLPSWGTGGTRNIEVAVNFTAGSVCTGLNLLAEVGPNQALGRYVAYEKYQVPVIATGDLPIFDILLPTPDRSIYGMHINDAADIDSFNIIPDINKTPPLFDQGGMPTAAWKVLLAKYQLSPQAGYTHIVPVRRKRHEDAIPIVPGLRFIPHFSGVPGGNSVTLYCEVAQGVQPTK